MTMGNIEAFANLGLSSESKTKATVATEFKGSLGLHLGGAYNHGKNRYVASFKTLNWDMKNANQTTTIDGEYTQLEFGVAHTEEITSSAKLFTQLYYRGTGVDVKFTSNPASLSHTLVPIVVGFELDAKDWLALRGSVSHNVIGKVKYKNLTTANFTGTLLGANGPLDSEFGATTQATADVEINKSLPNKTTVAAGATLKFGKLMIDGMIGTTGGTRGSGAVGANQGVLSLDNLMSRVSMIYWY